MNDEVNKDWYIWTLWEADQWAYRMVDQLAFHGDWDKCASLLVLHRHLSVQLYIVYWPSIQVSSIYVNRLVIWDNILVGWLLKQFQYVPLVVKPVTSGLLLKHLYENNILTCELLTGTHGTHRWTPLNKPPIV